MGEGDFSAAKREETKRRRTALPDAKFPRSESAFPSLFLSLSGRDGASRDGGVGACFCSLRELNFVVAPLVWRSLRNAQRSGNAEKVLNERTQQAIDGQRDQQPTS